MGRSPCCSKEGLNRGAWTAQEDKILRDYITVHGQGKWRNLPQRAGLKRCGKSCRLRWLNYLRPDIKRGNISPDEEELIIRLHKLLGNRWSLIAGRLPGRTDNEIKNYWNTNLGKKVRDLHTSTSSSQPNEKNNLQKSKPQSTPEVSPSSLPLSLSPSKAKLDAHNSLLVVTKAFKCSKSLFVDLDPLPHSPMPLQNKPNADELEADYAVPTLVDDDAANKQINSNCNETETNVHDDNGNSSFPKSDGDEEFSTDLLLDFDIGEICLPDLLISDFPDICDFGYNNNNNNSSSSEQMLPFSDQVLVASDEILKDSTRSNVCDEKNVADNSFSEE